MVRWDKNFITIKGPSFSTCINRDNTCPFVSLSTKYGRGGGDINYVREKLDDASEGINAAMYCVLGYSGVRITSKAPCILAGRPHICTVRPACIIMALPCLIIIYSMYIVCRSQ